MNVLEWKEVVERNKDDPLPSPTVLWIVSVREIRPGRKKNEKSYENLVQEDWKLFFQNLPDLNLNLEHKFYWFMITSL